MEVYAVWDDSDDAPKHQARLVALWQRTWAAQGWTPRLILPGRNLPKRGRLSGLHWINYSAKPPGPVKIRALGLAGWESAPVVMFGADMSPEEIQELRPC